MELTANVFNVAASGSRTTYGSERRNFSSAGGMGNDYTGASRDLIYMHAQLKIS
jgi:hypothetical protein